MHCSQKFTSHGVVLEPGLYTFLLTVAGRKFRCCNIWGTQPHKHYRWEDILVFVGVMRFPKRYWNLFVIDYKLDTSFSLKLRLLHATSSSGLDGALLSTKPCTNMLGAKPRRPQRMRYAVRIDRSLAWARALLGRGTAGLSGPMLREVHLENQYVILRRHSVTMTVIIVILLYHLHHCGSRGRHQGSSTLTAPSRFSLSTGTHRLVSNITKIAGNLECSYS